MNRIQLILEGYIVDVEVSQVGEDLYMAEGDFLFPIAYVGIARVDAVRGLKENFIRSRNLYLNVLLDELGIPKCEN